MHQYLIRQFKDSTGHIHTDIEKARANETLSIVEAESKEEAFYKHRYNEQLGFLLKYAVNNKNEKEV